MHSCSGVSPEVHKQLYKVPFLSSFPSVIDLPDTFGFSRAPLSGTSNQICCPVASCTSAIVILSAAKPAAGGQKGDMAEGEGHYFAFPPY